MSEQPNRAFLWGLISGVAAGALAAALFAPRSGPETREQVAEHGIELKNRAEDVVHRAQQVANEAVAKVQTAARELLASSSSPAG